MKVRAKETLKNSLGQVLFVAGRDYKAERECRRIWIINELHTETPCRESQLAHDFDIIEEE